MMDVEKYGVVGLIFVAGLLGLVFFYGPDDEPASLNADIEARSRGASVASARPVAGSTTAPVVRRAPRPKPLSGPSTAQAASRPPTKQFEMKSPFDGKGSFDFSETPIDYASQAAIQDLAGVPAYHEVASGDTMGAIAAHYYGTVQRVDTLLELNPGLEPRTMQVGQRLKLRASDGSMPASARVSTTERSAPRTSSSSAGNTTLSSQRTYTVQAGDVLGSIAKKMLGSALDVDRLFEANRHQLSSPDKLREGMVLILP